MGKIMEIDKIILFCKMFELVEVFCIYWEGKKIKSHIVNECYVHKLRLPMVMVLTWGSWYSGVVNTKLMKVIENCLRWFG